MAAEASEHAFLTRSADVLLKSDAGLDELYELKGELQSGAQAGCTTAVDRRTGLPYALTVYALDDLGRDKCEELAAAVAAQRRIADAPADLGGEELSSARLSLVREVLLSPTRLILVSELAPSGASAAAAPAEAPSSGRGGGGPYLCDDLLSVLQRRGRLAESDARRIFARLVLATKRAHDCGAVLRSIKPEVVQVVQAQKNGAFEVWLSQLHAAAPVPAGEEGTEAQTLTGLHGTPEYCAPEVTIWYWFECTPPRLPEPPPPYGAKADVWALGMCLHVMLCGCFPFQTSLPEEDLLRTINTADFAFNDPGWRKVSEEALDLVGQMLQRDPLDRPVLEEVLQHAFCADALQEVMAAEAALSSTMDEKSFDAALAALDSGDDDE